MPKTHEAKDASAFGSHRPRKLEEFLDYRMILTNFERLEFGGKPYVELNLIVESTGETLRINSGNKYVMQFIEAVADPTQCPINVIFYKPGAQGKTIAVKGWGEDVT